MPHKLLEVQRFMDSEELAAFCTVGSKNEPHVVPGFFTYSDGKVYVQTDRTSVTEVSYIDHSRGAVGAYPPLLTLWSNAAHSS